MMNRTILTVILVMIIVNAAFFAGAQTFRYESHGRRDPFVPLIGKERPAVSRIEDVTSIEDIKLEGIAIGPKGGRIAMINGEMLKEKKKIGDIEVKKITDRAVTISINGQDFIIKLPEEGGGRE